MHKVIPAINCADKDVRCVKEKLRTAELFAEWVHVDIADGAYTFNRTWNEPMRWKTLENKLKAEVHLMAEHPLPQAEAWLAAGAKRIILQAETLNQNVLNAILKLARGYDAEVMLSIAPHVQLDTVKQFALQVKEFQVLCVSPGLAGQSFQSLALDNVRKLRALYPDAIIEVDGGMDFRTARLAVEAGADILVSASFIFRSGNPVMAYEELLAVDSI